MAGFRKAKAEQAALKVGVYGPPGSGKTFTTLLMAEGLARLNGKRIAFVDTEHGTDFYAQSSPRQVHPDAFDFDALYTRSITETLNEVKRLKTTEYGVVVLDSVTHLWQACIEAYGGRQTSAGTIPMHAWGKIKKPYKELMAYLLASPMHVFLLGRQGTEYSTDEETEELKAVGVKMKAEGETAYEPHILIRMEAMKGRKAGEQATIVAYAEKDRTGVLAGRTFVNPTFDTICKPLMGLLGDKQASVDADASARDAEEIARQDLERQQESTTLVRQYLARIELASDGKALKTIGSELTPKVKSRMTAEHVAQLREAYLNRENGLKGRNSEPPPVDVREPGDD